MGILFFDHRRKKATKIENLNQLIVEVVGLHHQIQKLFVWQLLSTFWATCSNGYKSSNSGRAPSEVLHVAPENPVCIFQVLETRP